MKKEEKVKKKRFSTEMGFEPTRAKPIGLAVQRLNHSATQSLCERGQNFGNIWFLEMFYYLAPIVIMFV